MNWLILMASMVTVATAIDTCFNYMGECSTVNRELYGRPCVRANDEVRAVNMGYIGSTPNSKVGCQCYCAKMAGQKCRDIERHSDCERFSYCEEDLCTDPLVPNGPAPLANMAFRDGEWQLVKYDCVTPEEQIAHGVAPVLGIRQLGGAPREFPSACHLCNENYDIGMARFAQGYTLAQSLEEFYTQLD